MPWPADDLSILWQAATVVREHRGDGHVATLVTHGLDGPQAHVSLTATGVAPRAVVQPSRGWSDDEWTEAEQALTERGWLDHQGRMTAVGRTGRLAIEAATDRLAADPWRRLGTADTKTLVDALIPLTRAVTASGVIPEQNPMGLPIEL